MKRLIAIAVLLSVGFSIDSLLVGAASAAKPGGPTKLGPPIPYYAGNEYLSGQRHLYAADLNGDGIDEVVFSGHIRWGSKFRSAVVDNTGKNVTSKYIRPNKTSAELTEVYDLNNDGRDDLIFWGGTDTDYKMPSYVYLSKKKGRHIRKMVTPKMWYHGGGQGDLDGDGRPDFVGTGLGGKGKYVVSFKKKKLLARKIKYTGKKCCFDGLGPYKIHNGTDIAIGNFDADANIELIIADWLKEQDWMAVEVYKIKGKLIYVRDDDGISLPPEYFETAKGKAKIKKYYTTAGMKALYDLSHDVRLEPFDINGDGKLDLIRWSRPYSNDGAAGAGMGEFWPIHTYAQMLINNGKGKFTDKTAKYLKAWKMNIGTPYDFKYVDINKDGLTDIFYSAEAAWASEWKYGNFRKYTAGVGFLINTGKGFKNYGNAWIKGLQNKAMDASKKIFDYHETKLTPNVALGNFDTDADLEIASCALGGNNVGSKLKSYCAFWFSDITLKFPKYKAKKTSKLNKQSLPEDIHVIKKQPGKRIYTDQPWRYLE